MFKTVAAGSLITLFATVTVAQNAAHCTGISAPGERLKCFDQAYSQTPEPSQTQRGDWRIETEASRLDDSTTVYLSTTSIETLPGRFGRGEKALLMLRCKEGRTDAYIYFAGYFMADNNGGGMVDYRVDDRQAQRIEMAESTSNDALGFWDTDFSISFIKDILGGDELFVRARPYNEAPVEMTFGIAGLEAALQPLRDACGWQ